MQEKNPELTICSVYHSEMTKRILIMNEEFMKYMNPGVSWIRLAANNSLKEPIHLNTPGIIELPGGTVPDTAPSNSWEGYHDGAATNALLSHVKTRFALILDYDFFAIRKNWITETLNYMKEHNVALLGAPYHPKYWTKFRYFPAKYFLLVDLEKIGNEFYEWDFRPQYTKEDVQKNEAARAHKMAHSARKHLSPSWFQRFIAANKKRRYLGKSKDVCFYLYTRYYKNPKTPVECLVPAVRYQDFVYHYGVPRFVQPLLYAFEKLFPEKWTFVPKKKGYFTFTRFRNFGYYDALKEGLEEYFWQGKPFGFHLRGFKERRAKEIGRPFDPEETVNLIETITKSFKSS